MCCLWWPWLTFSIVGGIFYGKYTTHFYCQKMTRTLWRKVDLQACCPSAAESLLSLSIPWAVINPSCAGLERCLSAYMVRRTQILFPAPTCWLKTINDSSSRGLIPTSDVASPRHALGEQTDNTCWSHAYKYNYGASLQVLKLVQVSILCLLITLVRLSLQHLHH